MDVNWKDEEGSTQEPESSNDAIIALTEVPSKITVTKTAGPTVVQDSGLVTFTVVVRNDSAVDTVFIQTLNDSIYGNVNGKGTCTLEDGIAAGPAGSRQILPACVVRHCTFDRHGHADRDGRRYGHPALYDDDQPVSDDDDATVTFTATPPPPPNPKSDVTVTKTATSAVQLPAGGGTAPITYTIAAKNNGPDPAQNVHVSDAAPVDVTFISATTGKGTCTTTPQAVDCTISSLAVGESVPITINATVSATGTKTNVVVISNTTPPDTNPNNSTASASTLVTAPVTPPKPKPTPEICETLTVTPKVLKGNGKSQKVTVKVTKGKKAVGGANGQDHRPGDLEDGEDREERQGHRDLQAEQAGHHPGRDPGCEGL